MADDQGSTACLVSARDMAYSTVSTRYGVTDTGPPQETVWVYNQCNRSVEYSLVTNDDGTTTHASVAPGDTHVWGCGYVRTANLIGQEYYALAYCYRAPRL